MFVPDEDFTDWLFKEELVKRVGSDGMELLLDFIPFDYDVLVFSVKK